MQSCVAGGTPAGLAALRLQSSNDIASSLGSGSWLALWPLQHGVRFRHGATLWGLRQAVWQGHGRRCRRPTTLTMLARPALGAPIRLGPPWLRGGLLIAHAVEHDDSAAVADGQRLTIAKCEGDDGEREREKAQRGAAASAVRAKGFGAAAESARRASERKQQRKSRQRQPVGPCTAATLPVPARQQPASKSLPLTYRSVQGSSPGANYGALLARASRAKGRRPAARRRSRPQMRGSQTLGMWWAACCPAWRSWLCWRCCQRCSPGAPGFLATAAA